jgi:hypothetical protein
MLGLNLILAYITMSQYTISLLLLSQEMSIFRGIRAGVFCLICASQPKAKVISFYLNSKAILTEKKHQKKKLFFKRTGPKIFMGKRRTEELQQCLLSSMQHNI